MHHSACPGQNFLLGMVRGTLDEAQLAWLVEHLESCPDCERHLADLEKKGDTGDVVLDRLRQSSHLSLGTSSPAKGLALRGDHRFAREMRARAERDDDARSGRQPIALAGSDSSVQWKPVAENPDGWGNWLSGFRLYLLIILMTSACIAGIWLVTAPPESTTDVARFRQQYASLRAEQRMPSIMLKLTLVNTGFNGKGTWHPRVGPVEKLELVADHLTELWPLGVLDSLDDLNLVVKTQSSLSDLSGIEDLTLQTLRCRGCPITTLEPLRGMSLEILDIRDTRVRSLEPLREEAVHELWCDPSLWQHDRMLRPEVEWPHLELLNGKPYRPRPEARDPDENEGADR